MTRLNSLENNKLLVLNQLKSEEEYLNSEEYILENKIVKVWNDTAYLRNQNEQQSNYETQLKLQKQKLNTYKTNFILLNSELKKHIDSLYSLKQKNNSIDNDIERIRQEIEIQKKEYNLFDLNELTQKHQDLSKRKDSLSNLQNITALHSQNKSHLTDINKQIEDNISQIKENENALTETETALITAKKEFEQAKLKYEKISSSLDSWAKKTRLKLTKGDKCPLCGQVINEIFHEEDFKKIVEPLEKETTEKDKKLREIENSKSGLVTSVNQLQKQQNNLQKQRNEYTEKVKNYEEKALNLCNSLGTDLILDNNSNKLLQLIDNTSKSIKDIFNKIEQINQTGKILSNLQSQRNNLLLIKQQIDNENNLISSCLNAKKEIEEFTKQWENESLNTDAVTNLSEEWYKLKDNFLKWKNQIEILRYNIEVCKESIRKFFTQHNDIKQSDIDLLKDYNQIKIDVLNKKFQEIIDKRNQLKGALEHINNEIEAVKKSDIEIVEGENVENLQHKKKEIENEIRELQLKTGADKKTLEDNEKNVSLFEKKLEERNVLEQNCGKWRELSEHFGSADGQKFRKIAQSFILNDLLNKSNYYLRRFSDRFELCSQNNTLSIFIKDKFEGSLVSPVANLSGGEGFMVSLSLALGLSKMSSSNAFCNILFIDEGFGTLSGNCLNTVIETLEKLHQIGGRSVGVISHVADLKERISAQIRVKRKNATASEIETISV